MIQQRLHCWLWAAICLVALVVGVPAGLPCRAAQSAARSGQVGPDGQIVIDTIRTLGKLRCPEIVEMIWAIANGSHMGPGEGWFHAGQSRYGWDWLVKRHAIKRDGHITRKQFQGPAELFDRLDRDRDGELTAADFDWSDRSPFLQQNRMADMVYYRIDTDSNGRISRAEWDAFFKKAAKGKSYLTPEDLRQALAMPRPSKSSDRDGPSPVVFFRGLFHGELGSFREGPGIGDKAPDFKLPVHDGKKKIRLFDFRGKKPVVLVFGSFT
jgi:hypothetical protein